MKKVFVSGLIALSTVAFVSPVFAQDEAMSLEQLSQMVRDASISDTQESRERIAAFERQQAQQQSMLNAANAERDREERRSEELKATYDANELVIADKQQQLTERLGTLRELFGHLTGFIGDVREGIDTSIVSAQYPGRTEFMQTMVAQMASQTELPSIENINRVWSETLDQIIEGG